MDEGQICTTIAEKLEAIDTANLRKAHAMLETGRTIGKVLLENLRL